jgi:hypothetical protein
VWPRFDLLLELCSRRRAKTAASAARAALGETALQQAVAKRTHQSEKNDRKIMSRRQGPRLLCSMSL